MAEEEKENPLAMSDEEFMENYSQESESSTESSEEDNKESTEPVQEESNNQGDTSSTDNSNDESSDNLNESNSATIATSNAEPDYKALYQKIMAPFKADGRTIKLKDANEAIALMQKGVNYTRKTQNLAKYQKSILSLENANLLDNTKLNELISVAKGDKEAIKHLLKEHNIDPSDLGSDSYSYGDEDDQASNYVPPNNMVDDQYVRFRGALDEIKSSPEGQAIINDMLHSDERTKAEIYADPRILGLLTEHKASGIYDSVMNEVHRRRTIGLIDESIPDIYAYNQVGNEMARQSAQMMQRNLTIPPSGSARLSPPINPPMTRSTGSKFSNNARARSAASNRMSPATDKNYRNPLSMSDDEFMRTFGGR